MVGEICRLRTAFSARELTLAIVLVLTSSLVIAFLFISRFNEWQLAREHEEAVQAANHEADMIAAAMQRELIKIEVIARAVRFSLEKDPTLDQVEYAELVAPMIASSPSILNVGTSDGFIVNRVYPVDRNRDALGLDYRTTPDQLSDVQHVMETGQSMLFGPVQLVQGGAAFVYRTPYLAEAASDMAKPASGVISVVIDREILMAGIFADHGTHLDHSADFQSTAVRKLDKDENPISVIYGNYDIFSLSPVLRMLPFNNGTWQIGLVPSGGWPKNTSASGSLWALVFLACCFIGTLILVVWSMYRMRRIVESQLRSAINSIDDGFALFDANDLLVYANEKYRSYYALSRDAIFPGNSFENIIREGLKNGQYNEAVGREEEWLSERLHVHRNPSAPVEQKLSDGRWLKIAETRSPEGNTVGFRVDITELKEAREKAEAANRAKNSFLNMISHELRTPLTSIIGYARLLENPEILPSFKALELVIGENGSTKDQGQALKSMCAEISTMSNRVTAASDHLLSLINDILDGAKLEAKTIELFPEPLDLRDLVRSVTSGLSIKAAEKGIKMISKVEPFVFTADPKRLRQALINVVGNAIKFTDAGCISITSEQDEKNIRILVNDTGCGIREEDQEKIFDQFVQVDSSVTRRNSGAGLGLAITRELVGLHGGVLELSSELGAGTTVVISIPHGVQTLDVAA